MDTGKLDDYKFYEGYEGEPEITIGLNVEGGRCAHFWDGYFEDIFGDAELEESGWTGLTRDYNEMIGAFSASRREVVTDVQKYLDDLHSYDNGVFDYEETKYALTEIIKLFEEAQEQEVEVFIQFD